MTASAVIGEATHIGIETAIAVNVSRLIIVVIIVPIAGTINDLASFGIYEAGFRAEHFSHFDNLAVDFPSEIATADIFSNKAVLNVNVVSSHNLNLLFFWGFVPSF
jgi:hypothetical protein